jgi:hypothetical protein
MIEDFHQGNFDKGSDQFMEEAPEPTAKAYYDMLSSAQKPLHEQLFPPEFHTPPPQ